MKKTEFLNYVNITDEQFSGNEEIIGSLDLGGGLTSEYTDLDNNPITWEEGKYIMVDHLFTEVVSKRKNVYRVKKIHSSKVFYLVTDGNGKFSHGDTLKEAKEDLIYKLRDDIDVDQYSGLPLDHVFSFEEAIECYRAITGSCGRGVKMFIEEKGIKKMKYTIKEIIEITKGAYMSSEFKSFFN